MQVLLMSGEILQQRLMGADLAPVERDQLFEAVRLCFAVT
jgi:hypothetical protein